MPDDTTNYTTVTRTVTISVAQAIPTITWNYPGDIPYGTALGSSQLNATASVPGTFSYSPGVGTVLGRGYYQTLWVTFTPTDTTDYATVTQSVSINVV